MQTNQDIPVMVASGAGTNNQKSLGIIILEGLLASQIIGTLMTTSSYMLFQNLKKGMKAQNPNQAILTTIIKYPNSN